MLKPLRQLLSEIVRPPATADTGRNDERLAAAALLVHISNVDGVVADEERAKLLELMETRFDLQRAEAEALIDRARTADVEAVDLFAFTSVLKAKLDEDGRLRVIAMLWDMVFADGEVHEFEDNVVWRVAELLGVSSRDRVRLKQEARQRSAH